MFVPGSRRPVGSSCRPNVHLHIAHQLPCSGHGRIELDQAESGIGVNDLTQKAAVPAASPGLQVGIEGLILEPDRSGLAVDSCVDWRWGAREDI